MKNLNYREKSHLEAIKKMASGSSVFLKEVLEQLFYLEEKGRALIVQNTGHYSVFYLREDFFEDKTKKIKELNLFLELYSLLKYLSENHYLHFIPLNHAEEQEMYFVQDAFEVSNIDPKIAKIVLNKKGDYTSKPESILDKYDKVIYKGIFLNKEISDFLSKNMRSTIVFSEKEDTVSNQKKDIVSQKSNKPSMSLKHFIFGILLILICQVLFFVWSQYKNTSKNPLEEKMGLNTITDKLNFIEGRVFSLDSTLKRSIIEKKVDPFKKPDEQVFYGIDISHYDGEIVKELKMSDSISFVICKASEGLHMTDAYFHSNWSALKDKKIIRGAYHFYHTNSNPIDQAKKFISVVQNWKLNDIAPVIDIENQSLSKRKKISKSKIQNDLLKCLEYIKEETGRVPMIYTNLNFANTYLDSKEFSKYPLWLAHYTDKDRPTLPNAWKTVGFKIWQKTDQYHFKSRTEDFDIFYGVLNEIYE